MKKNTINWSRLVKKETEPTQIVLGELFINNMMPVETMMVSPIPLMPITFTNRKVRL